jgi:uncharacterized membrane protein YphA (DoxX/SURF4 family)
MVESRSVDQAPSCMRKHRRFGAEFVLMHAPMHPGEFSRAFFAFAAVSAAILSVAYGDFAPMWHSTLAQIPGREIWVCACALAILAGCVALYIPRWAVAGVLLIEAYLLLWLVTGIAPIIHKPLSFGSWYGFCEALTSIAGASIFYVMLRSSLMGTVTPASGRRLVRVAQVFFGLTCAFYGWSHFAYADYTASLVPAWLPARLGFAYLTGLGHIGAGIALTLGVLPRLAATLEAIMMSLFGILVWVPSFFAQPRPVWAGTPQNQWTELLVNLLLAASAWIVADSLRSRPWRLDSRR